MNQNDENYIIMNKFTVHEIGKDRKEKKNLTSLLPYNDNFTMYEYVSNVSMPSVSFLLNDGISNLSKLCEK